MNVVNEEFDMDMNLKEILNLKLLRKQKKRITNVFDDFDNNFEFVEHNVDEFVVYKKLIDLFDFDIFLVFQYLYNLMLFEKLVQKYFQHIIHLFD
jgi:hypothetical protein